MMRHGHSQGLVELCFVGIGRQHAPIKQHRDNLHALGCTYRSYLEPRPRLFARLCAVRTLYARQLMRCATRQPVAHEPACPGCMCYVRRRRRPRARARTRGSTAKASGTSPYPVNQRQLWLHRTCADRVLVTRPRRLQTVLGSAAVAISRHSGRLGRLRLCTPGQRVQCEPFDLRGELGLPEQVPPTLGEVVPQGSDTLPRRPLAAATQPRPEPLTPNEGAGASRTTVIVPSGYRDRTLICRRSHRHPPAAHLSRAIAAHKRDAKHSTAREREPP